MTIKYMIRKIGPFINKVLLFIPRLASNIRHKHKCNICGWGLKKYLPFGAGSPAFKKYNIPVSGCRLNALCPRCGSLERHRLLYFYFQKKSNIFHKNLKVLHVSPAKCLQRALKTSSNLDYLTADSKSSKAMIRMDITDINYEDNFFDIIICNDVLEHIPDDDKAMSELYRVLKPGGLAILHTPISLSLAKTYEDLSITDPQERRKIFGQCDHVRIYGRDYVEKLEKVGFFIETYSAKKEFEKTSMFKYGIPEEENIYLCSKPK